MRALPDRALRSTREDRASVTRAGAAADQRRRILRAIGELVAKRGYRAVTVELIASRAKVSYSTFYKHFDNKEDCFLALFDAVFATVDRRLHLVLADEESSWPEQVVLALRALVELIVSDPLLARACIVEAPTAGPAIFARYERAGRALVPLFERGRRLNPHGSALPSTLEVTLAGSVLFSAYQRLILGEVERIEDLLPEVVELVLRPYLGDARAASFGRASAAVEQPAAS
jgi:AcrR family transcriptional regulator